MIIQLSQYARRFPVYDKNTIYLPRQYLQISHERIHIKRYASKARHIIGFPCGICTEELGNPVYPPARRKLKEHGIDCSGKTARQITKADYGKFDYIFCADSYNIKNALRIFGGDPENKVCRLLDLTEHPRDIADPWYTGNFDITYNDITEGCHAFLNKI